MRECEREEYREVEEREGMRGKGQTTDNWKNEKRKRGGSRREQKGGGSRRKQKGGGEKSRGEMGLCVLPRLERERE